MEDYEKQSAQIKIERGRVKGSLTRLENSFENVNSKNDISNRLQRLDELLKDFSKLDSVLTDEDSELAEFEDRYFSLKSKYQDKLDDLNLSTIVSPVIQNVVPVSQNVQNTNNVRLPKLNIPVYTGKFTEWTNFKDLFVSTVHSQSSLSNIQKFQYLKGLISDEPASLIKHIPLSNDSYNEAWEKILDRYDKKKQIVQSLIKLFLEQKSVVQPNSTNLRNLLNTSDEVIRGLKALSAECNSRDPWLIYLLLQKLDPETKKLWSIKSAEIDFPTLKEFFDFLSVRCSSLELMSDNENTKYSKISNFVGSKYSYGKQLKNCIKCQGAHPLYKCMKFKNLDVVARKNFIKNHNLCYLCLNSHKIKDCPNSHFKCLRCQDKHNTLLHEEPKGNVYAVNYENKSYPSSLTSQNDKINKDLTLESQSSASKINSSASFNNSKCVSFLPTAKVFVYDAFGKAFPFRALLDCGSECSFVSESVINILRLKRKNDRIMLNGIAGVSAGQTRGSVCLTIGSKLPNESCINVQAYILPRVTSQLPSELIDAKNFEHLKNINLADEEFMSPKECDIILGSDCFFSILRYGKIVGIENEPIAQNTMFGWVVAGKLGPESEDSPKIKSHFLSIGNEPNVDSILKKFWETEEVPIKKKLLTEEEEFCEDHFVKKYRINEDGRFVVKIPVLNENIQFDDTKSLAIGRLLAMEKKFDRDPQLKKEYVDFMTEYKSLNHMQIVENNLDEKLKGKICYLPHHAVVRSDSISCKLRVVFDGTCKSANITSLNSVLGVGPVLQPDIFSILIKFRLPKIAFSADIKQMYRQILVAEEDQNLQRIVWRDSKFAKIDEFKLTTVSYGTASAPFLATRVLYQIAKDIENELPKISAVIKGSFYMDDCLSGSSNVKDAITTSKMLSEILSAKGFDLRKWRSNSSEFLSEISRKNSETTSNLEIHPDECSKTLGLYWDSNQDNFVFKINLQFDEEITKRTFLSQSAKLFDPLGLLSPCTILIKMFYQQLWLLKLDWDSPLPEKFKVKWSSFQKNFENLKVIQIPRWIKTISTDINLHGFCDASEKAYAAVIYAVQLGSDSQMDVTILVAKSKVAPLKPLSIPRLELNGALLLTRLFASVSEALSEYSITFHAWTDSQVVLAWLSSPPANWKPYIANRTAEILDSVPCSKWHYVPSKQNPADVASRGLSPDLLPDCELWFKGPHWLSMTEENWPKPTCKIDCSSDSKILKEKKKNFVHSVTLMHNDVIDSLFSRFSVLSKITDVIAYCRRFIFNCKISVNSKTGHSSSHIKNESKYSLSAAERKEAGNFIISYVQNVNFFDEIMSLKGNKPLKKSSSLCSLHPFIDSDGLLRVGGRIQNANVNYNAKHPIILPADHKFSKFLVYEFHIKHLHAGISLLSTVLKQNYWIVKSRKLIKNCIHNCVTCHRYRTLPNDQLMGSLPPPRVNLDRPFLHSGLDYAGPIKLKFNKGRGTKTTKGYIELFVCMATKAYHIEAVSDLTSEAFIGALRRFVARRGVPSY